MDSFADISMLTHSSLEKTQSKLTGLFAQARIKNSTESQQRFSTFIGKAIQLSPVHVDLIEHQSTFTRFLADFLWQSGTSMLNFECLVFRTYTDLYFHYCRWLPNRGRIGREFPQLLEQFNQLHSTDQPSKPQVPATQFPKERAYRNYKETLDSYTENISSRSQALEQRQLSGHINQTQAERAKAEIANSINSVFKESQLPSWFCDFIHQKVYLDLTALQLNRGNPKLLQRWMGLLEQLAWVYGGDHLTEHQQRHHQQKVYAHVPELIETINEELFVDFPDQVIYQANLEQLLSSLMNCIKQEIEETTNFPAIKYTLERSIALESSKEIKDKIIFELNEWFWLWSDNIPQPLKLYHREANTNLLHLSDYYGKHCALYSDEEFTFLIASKRIKKIPDLSTAVIQAINQYIAKEQAIATQRQQSQEHKNKSSKQEIQQSANKIEKEIENLKEEIKTTKQKTNARAQLETQRKANNIDTARKITKTKDEIDIFTQAIDKLQLGAWVEFRAHKETKQKLTLKLPSSDKYLFTDRLGRKVGEYKLAQLIQEFAEGNLQIVSTGEQFDSKLESIVRGQRR